MSKHSDPIWVEELLSQAGWVRRLSGELVTGDLAEDVSQDVLVASLHRPPGDRSAPRAWLKTVVNNMARSRFRSDRRRHDREVLTLKGTSATAESPEDLVARMELQRFLAEQILALGELQRQAIIMRYIDGLSAADIARSLGLPAGTIRRRLKEGLDRLRQTLDERHGRREVWMRALLPLMPQVQVQVDVGWSRGPGSSPAPAPAAAGSRSIGWLAAGIAGLLVVTAGIGVRSLWARRNAAGPVRSESLAVRIDPPRLRPAAPTPDTGDRAGANQAQVTGQVRDAGGRPAGRVTVTLASLDTSRPFGTTSTGADGRFEFAQVPAGDFGITASGDPGWAARAPITVRPSAATAVELVLEQAAGTLEGRVFDAGGGGLAGVTVTVWSGRQGWSPERVFERRTDEAGTYRLVLPVGRYLFRAKRNGYSRAEGWLDVPGRRRFDVRMLPGSRLTGRIVEGATGSPLADVQVTVVSAAGRPHTAETDASGGFLFEIDPGHHRLFARKGPLGAAAVAIEVRPAETAHHDLALAPVPAIAGRVLGPRGAGAAGVEITAEQEDREISTTSDAGGAFRIEGLPPGALTLTAEAAGSAPLRVVLPASPTGDVRKVELRLVAGAELRGRVVLAGGLPVAGARVFARIVPQAAPGASAEAQPSVRNLHTDDQGRFQLADLPAGDVWLAADAAGGTAALPASEPLVAGATRELELVLAPAARVSGRAVHPDGTPARGTLLEAVMFEDFVQAVAVSDDQGRFTLTPLAAGRISLQRGADWFAADQHPNVPPREQMLTLAPGEHRRDIQFPVPPRTGTISGTVLDSAGQPLAGAAVDLRLVDGAGKDVDFEARVFSDESGCFEFSEVTDGVHALHVRHPGFQKIRQTRIAPGARVVLRAKAR